ncbi:MAG: hypothetical protein V3V70_07245 [Candidatus Scalindua sp.]
MQADDKKDDIKHQNSYKDIIEEKLEKARFRYNFFRCESTYLTVLTIGLTIALITLITREFVDIPYYAYITLISLFTIYFFLTLATTINKWIGKTEAASILDKKMHFKERLVTGLEYADQKEKNKFFDMLANDITSKLDDKGIKAALPHKFPKATKFFVPVSILLLIFLLRPYIYPEKPVQIVTNGLTNNNLSKLSKPETKDTEDKKDELKQEEKSKEPQEEQENKKLAGTETEKSKKEQDKEKDQQLQAQATKDKTNPLQDEISKLLSKINATLAKFEDDKPKPGEKAESEKSKLSDQKAPGSQKKEEEPQQQTAKTETEPLESKEKEPAKTADASDSDKQPPEQEQSQEQAKDQKKKQQPKIPESKLLQKLAKLLMSQKDKENFSPPSIPLEGMDKDQVDSSKDQSDQNKETEPSPSSGSSGSSQQKSPQEELSKGTPQPEKPEPAPSGSDGKSMPESQQQETNSGTEDKVTKDQEDLKGKSNNTPSQIPEGTDTPTKGQKGSGDNLKDKLAQADRKPGGTDSQTSPSPATREDTELPQEQQQEKTDSKSTSDTEQTAKESEGGQEESQNAGGTEVASGKDKESGTGMNGSKTGQNQKEKQPGSTDKGSEKLPDQLDTQTASGEKKTGDQPMPSGSGEKNIPETKQQGSMNTGDQVTKKQGDLKGESDKAPSQTPEGADTQAKGQKDSGQDIKDKLAQGDMKDGEASPQPSPSSTSTEDMKSPEGKQEKDASGSEKTGSELMSGTKETTPDSQGEQGESQAAGGAKVASGKGTDAGTEPEGSKTGQQQEGQQETLKKGTQETEGGKEPGESAASTGKLAKKQRQVGKNGDKGEGESAEGTGSDRKSVESPGKHGGKEDASQTTKVAQLDKTAKSKIGDGKGNAQSSADLRKKIASQMESLSRQISNLEKKMGVDVNDNMEMEKGPDISELKPEGIDKAEQKKDSNELQRGISGITATPGSEPGKKLYSSEPEKIETPENAEKFKLQLKGTKEESGAPRETVSTGKGKATTKRKLPTVGYDSAARLSTQQAEDDTLKKTSIPLEYEEIIKQIHSEKE